MSFATFCQFKKVTNLVHAGAKFSYSMTIRLFPVCVSHQSQLCLSEFNHGCHGYHEKLHQKFRFDWIHKIISNRFQHEKNSQHLFQLFRGVARRTLQHRLGQQTPRIFDTSFDPPFRGPNIVIYKRLGQIRHCLFIESTCCYEFVAVLQHIRVVLSMC